MVCCSLCDCAVYRLSLDECRSTWHRAASILKTCIELNTVLAAKDLNLQSEILFIYGLYLDTSPITSPFHDDFMSKMRALIFS